MFSNAAGDYAMYAFTGTPIRWIGSKNDNHGDAEVYIDWASRRHYNDSVKPRPSSSTVPGVSACGLD